MCLQIKFSNQKIEGLTKFEKKTQPYTAYKNFTSPLRTHKWQKSRDGKRYSIQVETERSEIDRGKIQ